MPCLSPVLAMVSLLLLATPTVHADALDVKVWAVFAYINHGEKTPEIGGLHQVLTPAGAQQMYKQGQAFRSRYLTDERPQGSNKSSSTVDGNGLIQNISVDAIANNQLYALSTDDEWAVNGAAAFFQGLYPQNSANFSTFAGGEDIAQKYTSGSNITQYPLQGYQYPLVEALKISYDQMALGLQGNTGCYVRDDLLMNILRSEKSLIDAANSIQSTYRSIFSDAPFKGTLNISEANFWNAPAIYEFVNYMNQHNETVHKTFGVGQDVMPRLEDSATTLKQAQNGPSPNGNTGSESRNSIYMTAGKTLLGSVGPIFQQFINTSGRTNKFNVFFGSDDPMIAFFNLAGLLTSSTNDESPFKRLPEPGAAMVFELVTENSGDDFRTAGDLSVRFYYKASADADADFELHSLFGSGMDGNSIPLSGFNSSANELGMTAHEWCDTCRPKLETAPWCAVVTRGSATGSTGGSAHGGTNPISGPLAGVIGGAITLAITGLAALVAYTLLGVRLHRGPGSFHDQKPRSPSSGREDITGDKDVGITSTGIVHERVGSWEMETNGGAGRTAAKKPSVRSVHTEDEWEEDSVTGRSQVKAYEGV